jgi:pyruvate formate lyase activating enzyme
MGIKGFQGTSLLDFPGRIASLVFWGGCNLTCPYCHNPDLVVAPGRWPDLDPAALLADLAGRANFIDGVVVSGGEPTLDPQLADWLAEVKALGLAVKLDTNGLRPAVIADLLARGLVDSLAIDLKTAPARYPELHDGPVDVAALAESVRLALAGPATVEFRTTCVPALVDLQAIHELGALLRGAPLWVLQQYHPAPALAAAWREMDPYPPREFDALAAAAGAYAGTVLVRGL